MGEPPLAPFLSAGPVGGPRGIRFPFDAVISIGSFEMTGEERPQALERMVRVAKRGARIGVAEPMCLPVPIPYDLREPDRARFPDGRGFEYHFRSVEWTAELFGVHPPSEITRFAVTGWWREADSNPRDLS